MSDDEFPPMDAQPAAATWLVQVGNFVRPRWRAGAMGVVNVGGSVASITALFVQLPLGKGDAVITLTVDTLLHIILAVLLGAAGFAQFRAAWKIGKLTDERDAALRKGEGGKPNPANWPASTAIVVTDADVEINAAGEARFTFRLYNRSPIPRELSDMRLGACYINGPGKPVRWKLQDVAVPGGVEHGVQIPAHGLDKLYIAARVPSEHLAAVLAPGAQLWLGTALPRPPENNERTTIGDGLIVRVGPAGSGAGVPHSLCHAEQSFTPGAPSRFGALPNPHNTEFQIRIHITDKPGWR